MENSGSLFLSRRFLPMFAAQFLSALCDNLFRNGILVLVTFGLAEKAGYNGKIVTSIALGLFILPSFLFSATAGALVDRFEKTRLVQILKSVEFFLMLIAGFALVEENVSFMLAMLFLLGTQAAFFGPVKYSILPQLVGKDELVAANGYVEGGTFLAILIGTISGGLLIIAPHGTVIIAGLMASFTFTGWMISFAIPRVGTGDPNLRLTWRILSAAVPLLKNAAANRPVRRSILGISWFWFVGAVFLSVMPNYVKDVLHGDPWLVNFLLTLFSVGIGVGSVWCSRLLHGRIDARFVPLGGILI